MTRTKHGRPRVRAYLRVYGVRGELERRSVVGDAPIGRRRRTGPVRLCRLAPRRCRTCGSAGVLGPIWNRGPNLTELGVDARTGSIVSAGAVSLRNKRFRVR